MVLAERIPPSPAPSEPEAVADDELRAVLCGLATELAALSAAGEALQAELSPMLRAGHAGAGAQALDALTQALEAQAEFVEALARQIDPGARVDAAAAAAGVRLHDLALRLSGGTAEPTDAGGELELFD